MIRVTDHHGARLAKLARHRVIPALGNVLEEGAQAIAEDAANSIRADSISGPGHIPSLPGQPPNKDSGDLDQSIHAGELIETEDSVRTSVIADGDHAWLERGGSNVEPRPYMEPAVERARHDVVSALGKRFIAEVNT
jgi:hypothetical protein